MAFRLNYHHLEYFWCCARAGQVTAAAKKLGLSQSALSAQLKALERALGRRLLERSPAGVSLTDAGRLVFEHCERIFGAGAALTAELQGGEPLPVGFRLGVSSALGREVVLAFLDRVGTSAGVAPTVFFGPQEHVAERLSRRALELAVAGRPFATGGGASVSSRRLGALPVVFVAAPALAERLGRFPRRGQEAPMLLRTREHPLRPEVEGFLIDAGVRIAAIAETEDADLMLALARQGRGVAGLPEEAARRDIARGVLRRLGPARTGIVQDVWAAWPSAPPREPALRDALARALKPGPLAAV